MKKAEWYLCNNEKGSTNQLNKYKRNCKYISRNENNVQVRQCKTLAIYSDIEFRLTTEIKKKKQKTETALTTNSKLKWQ